MKTSNRFDVYLFHDEFSDLNPQGTQGASPRDCKQACSYLQPLSVSSYTLGSSFHVYWILARVT